ncbi:MAG TPA: hypothetical protein VMF50_17115 [Candidatus Binataceae bacterium]|nr:hypothetical protein [Candidatus Binataceae bacterium]
MERRTQQLADGQGRAAPVAGQFIEPMVCLAVAALPAGPAWEYELKFDGYRAIAFKTRNRVHLMSRNGKDFAQPYPALISALEPLPNETVVDGEIVVLDESGRPSFNLLQNYATREYTLAFYLFDLLILAGVDLRHETLETRRMLLHMQVDATAGRTNSFLQDDSGFRGGADCSGTRARPGRRDRQTPQQYLPVRQTLRRVGQNAGQPGTGAGYRRLCTGAE